MRGRRALSGRCRSGTTETVGWLAARRTAARGASRLNRAAAEADGSLGVEARGRASKKAAFRTPASRPGQLIPEILKARRPSSSPPGMGGRAAAAPAENERTPWSCVAARRQAAGLRATADPTPWWKAITDSTPCWAGQRPHRHQNAEELRHVPAEVEELLKRVPRKESTGADEDAASWCRMAGRGGHCRE